MKNKKHILNFIIIVIIIYFILSLPMMLGFGVAIDSDREVSWFTKAKTYFIVGIEAGYLTKLIISIVLTIIIKVDDK